MEHVNILTWMRPWNRRKLTDKKLKKSEWSMGFGVS